MVSARDTRSALRKNENEENGGRGDGGGGDGGGGATAEGKATSLFVGLCSPSSFSHSLSRTSFIPFPRRLFLVSRPALSLE
jgi:hypothetical protein